MEQGVRQEQGTGVQGRRVPNSRAANIGARTKHQGKWEGFYRPPIKGLWFPLVSLGHIVPIGNFQQMTQASSREPGRPGFESWGS